MKWLEPSTEELIEKHRKSNIIIYPLAFTIDNSETLYELDMQYRLMAERLAVKEYLVCPCLNDSIEFAKFIIELVKNLKSEWNLHKKAIIIVKYRVFKSIKQ